MNIKKNKGIILSILLFMQVLSVFLLYKSLLLKDTKLDEVKLKEKVVDNSQGLAIMIESEDGSGYIISENNNWPTENYEFNVELSGCMIIMVIK